MDWIKWATELVAASGEAEVSGGFSGGNHHITISFDQRIIVEVNTIQGGGSQFQLCQTDSHVHLYPVKVGL